MAKNKNRVLQIEANEFDHQYAAAKQRGEYHIQTTPRAESAYYDARRKRIVIELTNGCLFMFPLNSRKDLPLLLRKTSRMCA